MSDPASFVPRPRAVRRHAPDFDAENFLRELDIIAHRVKWATVVLVETFSADHPEYGPVCVVTIRLATLLERGEYAPYTDALIPPEKRALRAAHSTATRSGYQSIDG